MQPGSFNAIHLKRPDTDLCATKNFVHLQLIIQTGFGGNNLQAHLLILMIFDHGSDIFSEKGQQAVDQAGFLHIRIIYANETNQLFVYRNRKGDQGRNVLNF